MSEGRTGGGMESLLLGRWGEALVAKDLRRKGKLILAAGFECRFGEIDLIVEDGKFLAFIEVKLRKNANYGTPGEAVDARKQQRIRTTAEFFLMKHHIDLQPRFDVAEVYAPQGTETVNPTIHYIENAF